MPDVLKRIASKMDRAVRNGERLHLEQDEVAALYASEAGRQLILLAREEMLEEHALEAGRPAMEPRQHALPSPAGDWPPLSEEQRQLVEEAERRLAWEVVSRVTPRRRRFRES